MCHENPRRATILVLAALVLLSSGCSERADSGEPPHAESHEGTVSQDSMPQVVPYLVSDPSNSDGQGTATVHPLEPLPVGSRGDFQIEFTVGEAGISPGGFVMLQISPWWGWSPPQTTYPEDLGYTTVRGPAGNASIGVRVLPLNRVLVFSMSRRFQPGERIFFTYSGRVDKYAETELFQVFVDADGAGHSAGIAKPPTVRTLARKASQMVVTVSSQVELGKALDVRATPLDILGNWSIFPAGTYTLIVEHRGNQTPEMKHESAGDEEALVFNYTPAEEGIYFFYVEGPSGLWARSNVTLCQKGALTHTLYFGDIHGHSSISDGTGTPEDYYRYAREVSDLDIAALTDHSDYGTIPVKGAVWDRIKSATNNAYEPGRFVTFLGFEWTNWQYGHRNVYYRDGDGPLFRSIDAESDTPQELWKLLEPYEHAMTIAHHVGGGPVHTDWDVVPDKSREWLVEICSVHGSSEYFGCESSVYDPVEGAFVRDALAHGYTLGIIGGGDTHDGHPGQRSVGAPVNGILGVYSPELTREAIWDAFSRRHVYGTSGPKIILNFRVADQPMGSEVTWSASSGPIPIALRAIGCDEIDRVEIVRNGEIVFSEQADDVFVQTVLQDPQPPAGRSWYYARILQEDGNMAWSSPVWVVIE
jgi:hypothetical protein